MARILIAEDDDLTRELLVRALKRDQYELVQTSDGAEAIARLKAERFDLVLSDVQMSRASGMELLEAACTRRAGHAGDPHHRVRRLPARPWTRSARRVPTTSPSRST